MPDKRIQYISCLQILGPIFVVLGHSLNGLNSSGPWYVFSKQWIYIFHMPLFFLISGYLLSHKGFLRGRPYRNFIFDKFLRLIFPYLIWNLLFCIPKLIVQDYIVDSTPQNITDLLLAFLYPRQNIWGHTWFLLGLFVIYTISPLMEKLLLTKGNLSKILVITVCVILYMCPITTEFLAFSDLHNDLLFFVLGCVLGQIPKEKFCDVMKKQRVTFIVLAAIVSATSIIWYEQTKLFHFISCTLILLAFLSIGCGIENIPSICERLAGNSFAIYILHWPVMICVRIVMHQIMSCGIIPTAIGMSILGWGVPIVIVEIIRILPLKRLKKPLKYLLGV